MINEHDKKKVAVVTGGSSGIGAACVAVLQDAAWHVTVWDRSTAPAANASEIVDVKDAASVQRAAAKLDHVDLLVNAAGIAGSRVPMENLDTQAWDDVLAVNLSGTFYCCQALHRALKQRAGVIVNISSVAALVMMKGRAHYAVAKAGIITLTRSLAAEWASDGIRVVGIAPGYVKTPLLQAGIERGDLDEAALIARHPVGRLATPEEIAGAIVALALPPFAFMTGSTLTLDGGASLGAG